MFPLTGSAVSPVFSIASSQRGHLNVTWSTTKFAIAAYFAFVDWGGTSDRMLRGRCNLRLASPFDYVESEWSF